MVDQTEDPQRSDNLLDDANAPEEAKTRSSMSQTRFLLLHSLAFGAGNAMMADVKRRASSRVRAPSRWRVWEWLCHTRHLVTRSRRVSARH
jgi:hypothetical protein